MLRSIYFMLLLTILAAQNLSHKQSCQCVYLTGTQGKVWGNFVISSAEIRYNKSECLHIFITGSEQDIIELRFDSIQLRRKCVDQIHIYPHLHESVLQEPGEPEETICTENSKKFISADVTSSFYYPTQQGTTEAPNITSNNIESFTVDTNHNVLPLTRGRFRISNRPSLFSSNRVLGMRLIYKPFRKDEEAFKIVGRFQFIDRVMFKNDGSLVATTYCDYQFLPHPINYSRASHKNGMNLWRHFYSPRYPAKYPKHVKCSYKFVGRPRNRVEVLFEEIYLLTGHISQVELGEACPGNPILQQPLFPFNFFCLEVFADFFLKCGIYDGANSCLHNSDKITVYDGKTANMSSIIDVFCNERPTTTIVSSGPNLLIEFEASSNRTSTGFSAKYRFIDIFPRAQPAVVKQFHSKDNGSVGLPSSFAPVTSGNLVATNGGINKSDNVKSLSKSLKLQVTTIATASATLDKKVTSTNNEAKTNKASLNGDPVMVKTLKSTVMDKDIEDNGAMTKIGNTTGSSGPISSVRVCRPGSNCDKIISSKTLKNGTIQSPMFPGPYPARTLCRYEFQGQGRERIQVKFFEFSLPSEGDSYDCEEADILQVLIPIRDRYEPVETLCGDTMPKPIMSNGPKMLLEFRGRQSGKGNRGFKAEFKFLENFGIISGEQLADDECSFKFNSSVEKSGWFHSPNFPGAYPRNIECNYLFYGDLYDRIFIRFTYFDVEGIFPCEESTASDYVEFSNFMSIDRKFRRFCGKRAGFSVRSDGRFFRISFRTNDRFDKTGFRASYTFEAEQLTTESSYTQEINGAYRTFRLRLTMLLLHVIFLRTIFVVL